MPLLGRKKRTALTSSVLNSSVSNSEQFLQGSMQKATWKRQREALKEAKVVQKSALHVDKIVHELTDKKPFLLNTRNQPIAKFHRSEIVVGNLLGRGVFARVYEIKDLILHDEPIQQEEDTQSKRVTSVLMEAFARRSLEKSNQEMIFLDNSNSGRDEGEGLHTNAIDAMPLADGLDHQPLGRLESIVEDHINEEEQQEDHNTASDAGIAQNGDESSTGGTSSTAPASAPPTPPLTPASEMREQQPEGPRRRRPGNRFSTVTYMNASQIICDQYTLRRRARDVVRSEDSGYALKHLTKKLLRNPRDFHLAAAGLLIEAKFLSKLNHPNIIKVAGLPMGATGSGHLQSGDCPDNTRRRASGLDEEGLESGQHDSYFLITERLTDTLDRRIRQWKREEPTHKKLADQSSTQKIQTWRLMMRKTSYALQIANALAYLHERRLLYRDLKPQNIGFNGDNQTICIFNFGLCRELCPITNKVEEDDVAALFGTLSWKYTAVECFPQPIAHPSAGILAHSTKFLHGSSRSFGLDSLSNSARSTKSRKAGSSAAREAELSSLQKLLSKRDFKELTKQPTELDGSLHDEAATSKDVLAHPCNENPKAKKNMTTPTYDLKVDVYSWAMVYYEMLTLNTPFSGMTQKEHFYKVAGPKGGQRPGIYQFDLTPSMISLLQRAWDQDPKKRPAMESVCCNLQLILKELEHLIKEEQRALLKAAGGTEEAVMAFASKEARAALRAKRKLEKEKKRSEGMPSTRNSSVMDVLRRASDGVFAQNRYRRGDVKENAMETMTGFLGPLPKAIPGLENAISAAMKKENPSKTTDEIDLDALEYEIYSSDDEPREFEEESDSLNSDSGDDSSLTDRVDTVVTVENNEKDSPNDPGGVVATDGDDGSKEDDRNSDDVVGDAISAMVVKKTGGARATPRRERNFSTPSRNKSGSSNSRRRTHGGSMGKRRGFFEPLALQRRGTNRMSRRTMRLSRASIWMMRKEIRVLFYICLILMTVALCAAGYFWYEKIQGTWLGINLDELGRTKNETEAREILRAAITEACRFESPIEHDPSKPMLFKGGALSPVDLQCMSQMERQLEKKMIRVTGIDPSKAVVTQVGFLGMQHFAKPPPPQSRRSRWKRKKTWKFFRESSNDSNRTSEHSSLELKYTPDGGDPKSETCTWEDDTETEPPQTPQQAGFRNTKAWKFLREHSSLVAYLDSQEKPFAGLFRATAEPEPDWKEAGEILSVSDDIQ